MRELQTQTKSENYDVQVAMDPRAASNVAATDSINNLFTVEYDSVTAGSSPDSLRFMGGIVAPDTPTAPHLAESIGRHTTLKPHWHYPAELAPLGDPSTALGRAYSKLDQYARAFQNITLMYIEVGEQVVFINPHMIDSNYVISSADYITGPDAAKYQRRFLSILNSGAGQWTAQSRALAIAVRAMKEAIRAQNNDTNPYYDMPEAEIYDRITEQLILTARTVAFIHNADVALGLKRAMQIGAVQYYQHIYSALYTADFVTRLQERLQMLRQALIGAVAIPSMLRDYLQYSTIQLAPVQNGSLKLLVPTFAKIEKTSYDSNGRAISKPIAAAGDATYSMMLLPAAVGQGGVDVPNVQSALLQYCDERLTALKSGDASIVRTSTLGFSTFMRLGLLQESSRMVNNSDLVAAFNSRSRLVSATSQLGPNTVGVAGSELKVRFSEPGVRGDGTESSPSIHNCTGYLVRPLGFSVRRAEWGTWTTMGGTYRCVVLPRDCTDDQLMPGRVGYAALAMPVARAEGYANSYGAVAARANVYGDEHNGYCHTTFGRITPFGAGINSGLIAHPMIAAQHNALVDCSFDLIDSRMSRCILAYDAVLTGAERAATVMAHFTAMDDPYLWDGANRLDPANEPVLHNVLSAIDHYVFPLDAGLEARPYCVIGNEVSSPIVLGNYDCGYIGLIDFMNLVGYPGLQGSSQRNSCVFGINMLWNLFFASTGIMGSGANGSPAYGYDSNAYTYPYNNTPLTGTEVPCSEIMELMYTANMMPAYDAWIDMESALYEAQLSTSHVVTPEGGTLR